MHVDLDEFDSYDLEDYEDVLDEYDDLEDEESDTLYDFENPESYAETMSVPDGFYEDILEFQLAQTFYQSFILGLLIFLIFCIGLKK